MNDEIKTLQAELLSLRKEIEELRISCSQHLETVLENNSSNEIERRDKMLREGEWDSSPKGKVQYGWDSLVDSWVDLVPTIGDKIPSAYRIWQSSHRYLIAGDLKRADRCERLNYLFHNSYVPASLIFRGDVIFAYGGIGVILYKDADIHPHVTIGANVTIGGNGGQLRVDSRTGKSTTVPEIGTLTGIGAGANITGGIEVAPMTIVAPNAVLLHSTEPGSIMAGVPAKKIGQVTQQNALRYKSKYLAARSWRDEDFLEFSKEYLPQN